MVSVFKRPSAFVFKVFLLNSKKKIHSYILENNHSGEKYKLFDASLNGHQDSTNKHDRPQHAHNTHHPCDGSRAR